MTLLNCPRVGHGPFYGGANGRETEKEPPADCIVAKAVNKELKPSVDCFYSWERWHYDNFLFYVIRVTPTGQNSEGWAKGVLDNIKGEVSLGPSTPSGIRTNSYEVWFQSCRLLERSLCTLIQLQRRLW